MPDNCRSNGFDGQSIGKRPQSAVAAAAWLPDTANRRRLPGVAVERSGRARSGIDAAQMEQHQFQFAGYYAALEQGFYRDAGLDVRIREGGPGIDVAETVASSKADFGVRNASVLREWTTGRRLVVFSCDLPAFPGHHSGRAPDGYQQRVGVARTYVDGHAGERRDCRGC